jgi:protein involved in polysaccharide export with SLBB domain
MKLRRAMLRVGGRAMQAVVALSLFGLGFAGGPALAQISTNNLPTLEVLRNLGQPPQVPSQLLDQARERGEAGAATTVPPATARPDLDQAEVDAIASYCRGENGFRELAVSLDKFSRLERDYCRRVAGPLHQYGYDLFAERGAPTPIGIGSMPENYVLGIGDELIVTFYGQVSGAHSVRVDREGRIVLPNMLPILAAGRRLDDFRRELEERTKSGFIGTDVFVSVGSVRQVRVTVIGEVRSPGIHSLTALSTLFDAIGIAGGIRKTGSLRQIKVQRGGQAFVLDLYSLLMTGTYDYQLSIFEGDRIFVPTIGPTAAIVGQVNRPGIYELPAGAGGSSMEELLKFAGGTLRPSGHSFLKVSFSNDGREMATQSLGRRDSIRSGDIVFVKAQHDVQVGTVELLGHVTVPGPVALAFAPTVRALIGGRENLGDDPYLLFAVLETTDAATRARRLVPVNLEGVLNGGEDVKLASRDRLIVLSRDDVRYLMSTDVRQLILGKPVPGLSTLPPVQRSIRTELATLRKAAIEPTAPPPDDGSETPIVQTAPATPREAEACPGLRAVALLLASGGGRRFDSALLTGIFESAVEYNLRRPCPPVYENFPEVLPFALENVVALNGEVRRPGTYPVAPRTRLASLIAVADGLTNVGDRRNVEIVRLTRGREPQGAAERTVIDVTRGVPQEMLVGPSEVVRLQGQWVELIGQVKAPGQRTLDAAPTVARLIGGRENLGGDPYLLFAVLRTTDQATRSRRLFPVSLERVLSGEEDVALRDGDQLIVLSRNDVRYLMSTDVRNIILGRPVPGLSIHASALQSLTRREGAEASGGVALQQQGAAAAAGIGPGGAQQAGTVGIPGAVAPNVLPGPAGAGPVDDICPGLAAVARVLSVGTTIRFESALLAGLSEDLVEFNLRRRCPEVYELYPEVLPFLLEHVAAMNGEIRLPGAYPITPKTRLSSLIAVADGLTRDTDRRQVEISRVIGDGTSNTGALRRSLVDVSRLDADTTLIDPSDIVVFGGKYTDRDAGPVVLSGEFIRPGVYAVRKGERLSELIQRAGGLTPQAYPYGGVFTRERVKRAEAQALRRAAREIESALTVLASKPDVEAEQLAAVTRLSHQIESAEAVGRVVIEADPTSLLARPELDTVLEAGDRLFVPKRPNYVTISGDVLNPSTVQFNPGVTVADYVQMAGGYQITADDGRVFVVLPNGEARKVGANFWNFQPVQVPPGSTIVVPRDPKPFDFLEFARDITPILSHLALSAASLAILSGN